MYDVPRGVTEREPVDIRNLPISDVSTPEKHRNLSVFVAPVILGVPVLLVVLAAVGGLQQSTVPGLPVVPGVTLWSLPLIVWVRDIAMAATVGFILIGGVLAPRPDTRSGRLASGSALVWLGALVAQAVLTVSEVLALPLSSAVNTALIWPLLTQTTVGTVILLQCSLVAAVALLGWVILGRVTGSILLAACLIAAFLPGFTGHAGVVEGHAGATVSLGLHIVAASVWVGGLLAVVDYSHRNAKAAQLVLRRFSAVALVCVVILGESGLVNAATRLDGVSPLLTSTYGAVLLAKIAVLCALIGVGLRQRSQLRASDDTDLGLIDEKSRGLGREWRASPALALQGGRLRLLLRISGVELILMGVAYGLAVALSRIAPPGSAEVGVTVNGAALIVVGLAIPLGMCVAGVHWHQRWLIAYPETMAVAVLAVMAVAMLIIGSDWIEFQVISLAVIVVLIATGFAFWTAVRVSRSWILPVIVVVALPMLLLWAAPDAATPVITAGVVALGWGVLTLGVAVLRKSA